MPVTYLREKVRSTSDIDELRNIAQLLVDMASISVGRCQMAANLFPLAADQLDSIGYLIRNDSIVNIYELHDVLSDDAIAIYLENTFFDALCCVIGREARIRLYRRDNNKYVGVRSRAMSDSYRKKFEDGFLIDISEVPYSEISGARCLKLDKEYLSKVDLPNTLASYTWHFGDDGVLGNSNNSGQLGPVGEWYWALSFDYFDKPKNIATPEFQLAEAVIAGFTPMLALIRKSMEGRSASVSPDAPPAMKRASGAPECNRSCGRCGDNDDEEPIVGAVRSIVLCTENGIAHKRCVTKYVDAILAGVREMSDLIDLHYYLLAADYIVSGARAKQKDPCFTAARRVTAHLVNKNSYDDSFDRLTLKAPGLWKATAKKCSNSTCDDVGCILCYVAARKDVLQEMVNGIADKLAIYGHAVPYWEKSRT